MSDGMSQPPDKPKRPRAAQGTRRTIRKQTPQATPTPPLEQEPPAPLALPTTAFSTTPQSVPSPATTSQPSTAEAPIGERWGEYPPPERRTELEQRLQAWSKKRNHKGLSGPFADVQLTGADVYWLAAQVAGKGDVAAGCARLANAGSLVYLSEFHLEGANLKEIHLEGANLNGARLEGANLYNAQLQGAYLVEAQLQEVDLSGANLQSAHLLGAQLVSAHLLGARLQGANLSWARLEGANLLGVRLEGANLRAVDLRGANLGNARLDVNTRLIEPILDAQVRVPDVVWNGVSLNQVGWEQVPRLGDEIRAHQATKKVPFTYEQRSKAPAERLHDYQAAFRAYRQLAVALRGQGITEAADRFTYRALIMQRKALWWQMRSIPLLAQPQELDAKKQAQLSTEHGPLRRLVQRGWQWLSGVLAIGRLVGPYLFSWFLAVLTGYGFRLWRMIAAYVLLNLAFAGAWTCIDSPSLSSTGKRSFLA